MWSFLLHLEVEEELLELILDESLKEEKKGLLLVMYTSAMKTPATRKRVKSTQEKNSPSHDKLLTVLRLFFSWLACWVTPVCIGMLQTFDFQHPLTIIAFSCDSFFVLEALNHANAFSRLWKDACSSWRRIKRNGKGAFKKYSANGSSPNKMPFNVNGFGKLGGKSSSKSSLFLPLIYAASPVAFPFLFRLLGFSKLVQVWLTIPRLFRLRDLLLSYDTLKHKFTNFSGLQNSTVSRCCLAALLTSVYATCLAACWFYISCHRQEQCSGTTWVTTDTVLNENSFFSIYIRSMHFIVQSIFTVGYGDIDVLTAEEIAFALFLILNGSLYYAFLISAITSLISNKDVVTKMFRTDVSNINLLLQIRDVPNGLRKHINQLLHYSLARQNGYSENFFLKDIPKPLLREIKQTYASQLQQLPFFSKQSSRFIDLCVEGLFYRTYVPESIVFFQNERRREALLIKSGKIDLKIHSARGTLFSCMAGDSIGDFQLVFGNPSEVTAQANTFTEVMVLSLEAFSEAIRVFNLDTGKSSEQWLGEQSEAMQSMIDSHKKTLIKFVKVRITLEGNKKNKRMLDMMENVEMKQSEWIVLPESKFRPIWASISLVGIAYFVFAIPIRIYAASQCSASSIKICLSSWNDSLFVDYVWDAFFVADFLLQCFFVAFDQFENDRHVVVTDRRKIFQRFVNTMDFFISMLAIFPLDVLAFRYGCILCFRVSKLLLTLLTFDRISVILVYFEHHSSRKKAIASTESITVLHLGIVTLLMTLWTAICWSLLRHDSGGNGFISGLYWTMTTMTTVGFGDIVPETNIETFYAVAFCIAGPLCSATIIANAASFINTTNVSVDNINHRQVVMKAFMSHTLLGSDHQRHRRSTLFRAFGASSHHPGGGLMSRRVHPIDEDRRESQVAVVQPFSSPDHTAKELIGHSGLGRKSGIVPVIISSSEVFSYLDYVSRERKGLDEEKLANELLPGYVQESLQQARVIDILLSSVLFSKCHSEVLRDVMLAAEVRHVGRFDRVVTAGCPVYGCYLIMKGMVLICTAQGRNNHKLTAGEAFAEMFLLEESYGCPFSAEAQTECELLFLRRVQFLKILREHNAAPTRSALEHMREVARKANKKITSPPQPSIRSVLAMNDLMSTRAQSTGNLLIDPKSLQYLIWISFLSLLTLSNIILLPGRLAFTEDLEWFLSYFAVLDYLCDVIFVVDIFLRCGFIFFYDSQGPVLSKAKIKSRYIQSGQLYVHVLAAIPFDLLLLCGGDSVALPFLSMQQSLALLRFNKLLRSSDLRAHCALVEERLTPYFGETCRLVSRVCKLTFAVVILAHCFGCFFFIVGNQEHIRGSGNNWADHAGILRGCSLGGSEEASCSGHPGMELLFKQYVYSIYWAVATLTTVGYGDISSVSSVEQSFTMVVFLVGTAAYTIVVTNLEDIVSNLDVSSDLFKDKQSRIRKFLSREKMSDEYFRKLDIYLKKIWLLQKGERGQDLKAFLPSEMYGRLVVTASYCRFESLFFVGQMPLEFMHDLAERMVQQVYIRDDTIFRAGEAANILYTLFSGESVLVNEVTGQQYERILPKESHRLGSADFFSRQLYKCTAEAATDVVMFELTFAMFWQVVELHNVQLDFEKKIECSQKELSNISTSGLVFKFDNQLEKNAKMFQMMKVNSQNTFLEEAEACIRPDSLCSFCWSVVSICFIFYVAFSVPYYIAFSNAGWLLILGDILLFVFSAMDIYLRLYYFAVVEDGVVITEQSLFSSIYIEEKLKWDVLASLPIGLIVFGCTLHETSFAIARGLLLCRLNRLNGHFHDLLGFISASCPLLSPDKLRVFKAIFCVCYLAHVSSCILCLVGLSEGQKGVENWIESNGFHHLSPFGIYLRAYFWAFYTIVTVGYGSIQLQSIPEMILAIGVMIIGAIMCDAGITAMLSSIIANIDQLSGTCRRSRQAMLQFCASNGYSDSIQRRVAMYYDYLSSNLHNSVEARDFQLLPEPLQIEFSQIFAFDALCSLCLLDAADDEVRLGFVYSLLRHAELTIATPGQVILPPDGLDIHILRRGKAYSRVSGESETVSLNPRDYYEEGEALCREGRLNTSAAMSPGKLVTVKLCSFESIRFAGDGRRRGSVYDCNHVQKTPPSRKKNGSLQRLVSARRPPSKGVRATSRRRSSALLFFSERYLGITSSLSALSSLQSSSIHARLNCGARKMVTSTKPLSGGSGTSVLWDEEFTFHVPKAASTLKIVFFDDNQLDNDNGYVGRVEVQLDGLSSMDACRRTLARESEVGSTKQRQQHSGGSGRNLTKTKNSFGASESRENNCRLEAEPDEFSCMEDIPAAELHLGSGVSSVSEEQRRLSSQDSRQSFFTEEMHPDIYTYHLKRDVRDKHGRLQGIAEFEVTVRGAGMSDFLERKKSKALYHWKQLSCAAVEVVAESFCHLITIPAEKLVELRSFYGNVLSQPSHSSRSDASCGGAELHDRAHCPDEVPSTWQKQSTGSSRRSAATATRRVCPSSKPSLCHQKVRRLTCAAMERAGRKTTKSLVNNKNETGESEAENKPPSRFRAHRAIACSEDMSEDNLDEALDDFDSEISDDEMEEAFGLAQMAMSLRKDSSVERCGFRLSWT